MGRLEILFHGPYGAVVGIEPHRQNLAGVWLWGSARLLIFFAWPPHSGISPRCFQRKRRPSTATKSLRKRHGGPWVWLAYREECCLFPTQVTAPCFLAFVRRVHSPAFEGSPDAPRFLASRWFIGIRVEHARSRSVSHPGARYRLAGATSRLRGRRHSRRMLQPTFIYDRWMP